MFYIELLWFVLLLCMSAEYTLQRHCDHALCNYEGVCTLQLPAKEVQCKCIGEQYFEGVRCMAPVDNCVPNPCQNGAQCQSVLGAYICAPCPPAFAGLQCSIPQENTFTKFYVHYNRLANYGQPLKFLLTLETLGTALFHIEVYASTCLMALFTTFANDGPRDIEWKRSDDLRKVASSLGLRHVSHMPYNSGYYYVATGTLWVPGETEISVVASNKDITSSIVFNKYKLFVLPLSHVDCVPQLTFAGCSHPKSPLDVDTAVYSNFEVTIIKRCHSTALVSYEWGIYSALGEMQIYDLLTTRRTLKIPPYTIWTSQPLKPPHLYMIEVKATEYSVTTAARCYISTVLQPVVADIIGGNYREVNAAQAFIIDGSRSRNLEQPPDTLQSLNYRWDCISETDTRNSFCRSPIDNDDILAVPANKLQTGHSYKFTFTATAQTDLNNSNQRIQTVKVIAGRRYPLYIAINCIRNCKKDRFNANQVVHLEAKCLSESISTNTNFVWKINQNSLGFSSHFVYEPPNQTSLQIEVVVKVDDREGSANIQLTRNALPSGGSCQIEPTVGEEYTTLFQVKCTDFIDENSDDPLTYEYTVNNFTLQRTTDHSISMRLPTTNSLKITICDSLNGCITTEVTVSVNNMHIPEDITLLHEFFALKENNLQHLMDNDIYEYFMLFIYILSNNVSSSEALELIWDQINVMELQCLLNVEQMMHIICNFINILHPIKSKNAKLLAEVFEIFNNGMLNIINDGEIREISSSNYMDLIKQFIQILFGFTAEPDLITPPPQPVSSIAGLSNYPMNENYADMFPFDITILPRINDWMHLYRELNKCLNLIGVLIAYNLQPGEPPLDMLYSNVELQAFSTDDNIGLIIDKGNVTIDVSRKLLQALQIDLESHSLLVQTITSHTNPFWWYPDDTKLSTVVFALDVFTPTSEYYSYLPLKEPLTFNCKILRKDKTDSFLITDTLVFPCEILMYKVNLPAYSLLYINFETSEASLLVELKTAKKVRACHLRHSKNQVPFGGGVVFTLINNSKKLTNVYIAITSNGTNQSPVTYSFRSEIRQCLYFEFKSVDPGWTNRDGCMPSLIDHTDDEITCNCYHMSVFSAKIIPIYPKKLKPYQALFKLSINYIIVALLVLFIIIMLIVFVKACIDAKLYNKDIYLIQDNEDVNKTCNIKMDIATGAQANAGTTANVIITVIIHKGPPKHFTIYQNPYKPKLKSNSVCTIWLPLNYEELLQPLTINIRHNNEGPYPTWYCRYIDIYDLKWKYIYRITVEQWIRGQQNVILFTDQTKKHKRFVVTKCLYFLRSIANLFTQWFMWKPICGAWQTPYNRASHITRYERTFIWFAKFWLTICIVTAYFGPTTLENYEEERENYYYLGIPILETFKLSAICYSVNVLLHVLLLLMLKILNK